MKELRFTIPLAPVTKKNSQRIANCGQYSKILPSKAYVQYEKDAGYFLPNRGKKHTQPCEVVCLFYMPTKRRVDLTNLLEAIDDVLVKYGVLKDDNIEIITSTTGAGCCMTKTTPGRKW